MTEVLIRLELLERYSKDDLKDIVYTYLSELIEDDSLGYSVVEFDEEGLADTYSVPSFTKKVNIKRD